MGTVEARKVDGKNYVCVIVNPNLKKTAIHHLKKDPASFVAGTPEGKIAHVCYPAERGENYAIERIPKILAKDAEGCKLCKVGAHKANPPKSSAGTPKTPPYSVIYMKSDRGITGWYCTKSETIENAMKCLNRKPVVIPTGLYVVFDMKSNFVLLSEQKGKVTNVTKPTGERFYLVKKDQLRYFYAVEMFKPFKNPVTNPVPTKRVTEAAEFRVDTWIKSFDEEADMLEFVTEVIKAGYSFYSFYDKDAKKWTVHFKQKPPVKSNPAEAYSNPLEQTYDNEKAFMFETDADELVEELEQQGKKAFKSSRMTTSAGEEEWVVQW